MHYSFQNNCNSLLSRVMDPFCCPWVGAGPRGWGSTQVSEGQLYTLLEYVPVAYKIECHEE